MLKKKNNYVWLVVGVILFVMLIGLMVAMVAGVGIWMWLTPVGMDTTGPTPVGSSGPQVMPFYLDSSSYNVYEGAGDTCDFEIGGSVINIHDTPMTGVKVSCFFVREMGNNTGFHMGSGSHDIGTISANSEEDISFQITVDKFIPSDSCWDYVADCDLEYTL